MLLSLPQNHPLTEEENLDATQLANQQWIAVIHNDDVHSRDGFVETCVKAGAPDGKTAPEKSSRHMASAQHSETGLVRRLHSRVK